MFMIWDSSHEDLQLFDWVSNTASYEFISLYVNPPSYSYDRAFIEIWPSKSNIKVIPESHIIGITSYRLTSLWFHVNLPSHSWVMTFFKIWRWNSKVKVMGEVTVQSHNVGLTSYRLTSLLFHVNWPSHSWNTASSKFDLENQGSRSNDPDVAQLQV